MEIEKNPSPISQKHHINSWGKNTLEFFLSLSLWWEPSEDAVSPLTDCMSTYGGVNSHDTYGGNI